EKPGQTVPPPASRHRRRGPFLAGGATLLALIIVAGLLSWLYLAPSPARSPASPARSIAVLPFENLSTNPANAYFAAGIQDTILTKLSGIADLHVISRTSTEHYPSHPRNLHQIARELGVTSVLEGSVQKAGNQVLINVQLIDAATDNHIWAQAYTRTLDNVFAVESDVAEQVAAALKAKLLPTEKARVAASPTHDPKAYDLFLQANYLARQITGTYSASDPVAITDKSISLYHKAIARDPHFALAYARLSYLESRVYWRTIDHTAQRIAAAREDAHKALELAPDLGEAHLAAGYAAYYGKRNYAAALKQFEFAARTMPNNAEVLGAISLIQRRQGDWRHALVNQRKAAGLDPRNPHWAFDIGSTLALARHYPQAIREFDRALAIEPYNFLALTYKVWTELLAGETKGAAQTIAGIPPTSGPFGQMASVRFRAAWLNRQPRIALETLTKAPDWIQAPDFIGQTPTNLWRAQALRAMGKKTQARAAYAKARAALENKLQVQPENPDFLSALGLVEAGLDNKAEAIRNGLQATRALPIGKDAIAGTLYVATLAKIYAHYGDATQSEKLVGKLLTMPAGLTLSVPLLKLDPVWDPIRHDPAFQALLKRYGSRTKQDAPKTQTFSATVSTGAASSQ
ncbi:MAG: tetratricopeptide repeat protein, partial [Gammaproteobacteria bacterium]